MNKLIEAKIKLEAVLRYAEDALIAVNEAIEEDSNEEEWAKRESFLKAHEAVAGHLVDEDDGKGEFLYEKDEDGKDYKTYLSEHGK